MIMPLMMVIRENFGEPQHSEQQSHVTTALPR
jgi:hypothetical protein